MKRIFILIVIFSLLSLSCGQKQRRDNFQKKEEIKKGKVKIYSEEEISDLCSLSLFPEETTAIEWPSVAAVIVLVAVSIIRLTERCCRYLKRR